MISRERIQKLKDMDIRMILDDFGIPRTERNCRCPNPEHEDKSPSCLISYADDKISHMSVLCFAEDKRWDCINLYMLLKRYDRKLHFVKAIHEMESRYFSDEYREEIASKRRLIHYEVSQPIINTNEDVQEYIDKMLNNKIERFKVFEWKGIQENTFSVKMVREYFEARCLDCDIVFPAAKHNGIRIFHQYDKMYYSNFILYVCQKEEKKFIIRKRIDGYFARNKNKSIKKLKGNIGNVKPLWLYPENNNNAKYIIVTEGLEDAFTAIHMKRNEIVVSLNSTKQVNTFIHSLDSHREDLANKRILIALDNDSGGYKASNELKEYFLKEGYQIGSNLFFYTPSYNVTDLNADWIRYISGLEGI